MHSTPIQKSLFRFIIRNKRSLYNMYHYPLCLFRSSTMALYMITVPTTGTMALYLSITADLLTFSILDSG